MINTRNRTFKIVLNSVEDTDWSAVSIPNPSPLIMSPMRLFMICNAEEDSIPLEKMLIRPYITADTAMPITPVRL